MNIQKAYKSISPQDKTVVLQIDGLYYKFNGSPPRSIVYIESAGREIDVKDGLSEIFEMYGGIWPNLDNGIYYRSIFNSYSDIYINSSNYGSTYISGFPWTTR